MLDVDAFLAEESREWAAFRGRFTGLGAARFLEPGIVGDWTARDLLAHVACWHRWMSDKLNEFAGGFGKLQALTDKEVDALNAGFVERFRDWPADAMLVLSRDAHTRAVVSIRASSFRGYDEDWEKMIRSNTTAHYAEHIDDVDRFIKERS